MCALARYVFFHLPSSKDSLSGRLLVPPVALIAMTLLISRLNIRTPQDVVTTSSSVIDSCFISVLSFSYSSTVDFLTLLYQPQCSFISYHLLSSLVTSVVDRLLGFINYHLEISSMNSFELFSLYSSWGQPISFLDLAFLRSLLPFFLFSFLQLICLCLFLSSCLWVWVLILFPLWSFDNNIQLQYLDLRDQQHLQMVFDFEAYLRLIFLPLFVIIWGWSLSFKLLFENFALVNTLI